MKERYHYMAIALTLLDDDPEISGWAANYAAKHWTEGCDPVLDAFIGQAFRGCGQDNPDTNGPTGRSAQNAD